MVTPYSIISPLTQVQIPRRLPMQGEVLVKLTEFVEPTQVIARVQIPPDFRLVNLSETLGVEPKQIKPYLKVKIGQRVKAGQIVAERGGLTVRTCRSPIEGTVTAVGRGRMLIEAAPTFYELTALVPGAISEVWPNQGAVVEATGAYIQAAWGNQKETFGVLKCLVKTHKQPIRVKTVDNSVSEAIIVGGGPLNEDILAAAEEVKVRAVIVGSIPASLILRAQAVSFTVIATEGVGEVAMSPFAFDLLKSLAGREAAVCGRLSALWPVERPYIFVPLPGQAPLPPNPESRLTPGMRVRALRMPYLGMSGIVEELPQGLIALETGARVPGARVKIGDESILIPLSNLERLL